MTIPKIQLTKDGSHTLVHPIYNSLYHSANGAVKESDVIYINSGLFYCINVLQKKELSILEIGFGSGLNAFNTFVKSQSLNIPITYTGIENYPLDPKLISQLNYVSLLKANMYLDVFKQMHSCSWEKNISLSPNFKLFKQQADFFSFDEVNSYDLIYFDAFSPDDQPELWTETVFIKMYNALKPEGVLVTYSSKGIVKRALRAAGFKVKRLVGPPGKHHILRALKNCD